MVKFIFCSTALKAGAVETAFGSSVETTTEFVNENAGLATQVLILKNNNYE